MLSLQMANRSSKCSQGMIDNVLIQVENFIFFADFIILDRETDWDMSVILD